MTDLNDFLSSLPPLRKPRVVKPKVSRETRYDHRRLYYDARRVMFGREYKQAYESGEYYDSTFPKIATSNGLTMAIINFLNWSGYNADRTGTQGRMIKDKTGNYKRITSGNRKGTSDISATLFGRSVKLEIKVGKDQPSPDQLREQIRERGACGVYEFIRSFDEFFDWYFGFLKTIKSL